MQYFYEKSNAIVEVIAIELVPKIAQFYKKNLKILQSTNYLVFFYFLFWEVNGFMISEADYFEIWQLSILIFFLFWVVNGFMISDAD